MRVPAEREGAVRRGVAVPEHDQVRVEPAQVGEVALHFVRLLAEKPRHRRLGQAVRVDEPAPSGVGHRSAVAHDQGDCGWVAQMRAEVPSELEVEVALGLGARVRVEACDPPLTSWRSPT